MGGQDDEPTREDQQDEPDDRVADDASGGPIGQHGGCRAAFAGGLPDGDEQPDGEGGDQHHPVGAADHTVPGEHHDEERCQEGGGNVADHVGSPGLQPPEENGDAEDQSDVDDIAAECISQRDLGASGGGGIDADRHLGARRREGCDRRSDDAGSDAESVGTSDRAPHEELSANGGGNHPGNDQQGSGHGFILAARTAPMSGQKRPGRLPPSHERAWFATPADDACLALGVDVSAGLDSDDAHGRLAEVGPNRLADPPTRGPWMVLLDQFRNVLIVILMIAAVVAGLIGDFKDTLVIGVVLLFNALLGFFQEYRAERSLEALKGMLVATARVRRDGEQLEVPSEELVPGDVVLLEAGDRVPADGRIVLARNVEIDESSLTGESVPTDKDTDCLSREDVPLAERSCMAFMNTVVTRGRLEMLVTSTGMGTQMGRLAEMLQQADAGRTPLQVQLDALGKRLAVVAGVAVAVFFTLEMLRGQPLSEVLLSSVALAVAAVPEGLPAVVTVTLSVGTYALARRGAIVKRLASVETLGCTSVICSDKTGTLTVNQMTARQVLIAGASVRHRGRGLRR